MNFTLGDLMYLAGCFVWGMAIPQLLPISKGGWLRQAATEFAWAIWILVPCVVRELLGK